MNIMTHILESFLILILLFLNSSMFWGIYTKHQGTLLKDHALQKCGVKMLEKAYNTNDFVLKKVLNAYGMYSKTSFRFKTDVLQMLPCVSSNPIKLNQYTDDNIVAYVISPLNENIYVNAKRWSSMELNDRVKTIIHECSHLILKTEDYGYDHQIEFYSLKGSKSNKNADTYAHIIYLLNEAKC